MLLLSHPVSILNGLHIKLMYHHTTLSTHELVNGNTRIAHSQG